MNLDADTIYCLENPEAGIKRIATGKELKYEDVVKEVFGVADINDLMMMIEYNKQFQLSVCNAHGIQEDEIKLEMIFRVATAQDKKQAIAMNTEGNVSS
ncbi:hypothetical protein [Metabacillus niabensis]|uniref:Uncharacterized protein n=1 Tax=Metabacillus niabensis TaxID=324854 RepID=A0ABT9Z0A6_9BACI|nr:hypothetical protein [Metabacillus niabensis]MDQ0225683.1 hypothetical protein [Metabacillus niabensis]